MNHTLSYLITLLHRDFLDYTAGQLRALGLTMGSLPFILYVGKHPGCSPSQLTGSLKMDWGHSQRTLDRLEEGRFLTREKTGRSYSLSLTDAGQQAFSVCHQVFSDWDSRLTDRLSPEDRQQLLHLLESLAAGREDCPHV